METRKAGGMVEFLPTPLERKDGLIRDHVLELLEILDQRLELLEKNTGLQNEKANRFRALMSEIHDKLN